MKTGNIAIHEWPQPLAEIEQDGNYVIVRTPDEARLIIDSMQRFLVACTGEGA